MDSKCDETEKKVTATSTPSDSARRGTKRPKTRHPGSESSLDGDLSYLDLDTGKILAASRDDNVTLSKPEFDSLVAKLDSMQAKFETIDKVEKGMSKLQTKFETVENLEKCMTKLNKLDKLDSIEVYVRKLTDKVNTIDERLLKVENVNAELQKSTEFLSDNYDILINETKNGKKVITEHDADIQTLFVENKRLKHDIEEMRGLHKEIKADLLDSKSREMRDNLLFMNVEEDVKTNRNGQKYEETEQVLNAFLGSYLGLSNISFERVHRIPTTFQPDRDKPRPIVAKFTYFKDRELVRRSDYMLKGTRYGINEQFPEEIEQKRRELYPIARHYRGLKKRVILVRDRLFVDGEEIRAEDVGSLQEARQPRGPTNRSSAWNAETHSNREPPGRRPDGGHQPADQNRQAGAFQPTGNLRGWSRGRSHRGRWPARGSRQPGAYRGTGYRGDWSRGGHQAVGDDRHPDAPQATESTHL